MLSDINFWVDLNTWLLTPITFFPILAGVYRYKRLGFLSRLMVLMIICNYTIDWIFHYLQVNGLNYTPVLVFSYFFELLIISLFFNFCIPYFKKIRLGIYIVAAGFLFWLLNTLFYLPIGFDCNNHSYWYYTAFMSLVFMVSALITLYLMLKENSWQTIKKNAASWLLISLLFRNGFAFIYGIILPLVNTNRTYCILSIFIDWLPDDLFLISLGIIFLRFTNKKVMANE